MARAVLRTGMAAAADPRTAATEVAEAYQDQPAWLDAFAEHLDHIRAGHDFVRVLELWGLSQSQVARYFDVSRQAVGKWIEQGIPAERAVAIADLAAATDLLVRYLKRDRIAAVVRRPVPAIGGQSLLALLAEGHTRAILDACRRMFDFEQVER